MNIRIRAGSVTGRDHIFSGRNRQDSFAFAVLEDLDEIASVGILSDGCGEGKASEVGANLVTRFMLRVAISELRKGKNLEKIARILRVKTLIFLKRTLWSLYPEGDTQIMEDVSDFFLATIFGFVTSGTEALIFRSGDGTIFVGDEQEVFDQDDKPEYLAYQLSDINSKKEFDMRIVDLTKIERFAIASDGFEPELISEFWGNDHPRSAQRLLNVYSKKKHFKDDATLITFEITSEGGNEDGGCSSGEENQA